jgi:hypothetical protein
MLPRSPLFWVIVLLIGAGAFASKNPTGFAHFGHAVAGVVGLMFSGLFAILSLL